MRLIQTLLLVILITSASVVLAEPQGKFSFLGGGGFWFHPEPGGHGIGIVAYDINGLPRTAHLGIELNTDTLRISYDRIRFADGLIELGASLAGEAVFAGLLPDYYREGVRDSARGFWASYLAVQGYGKLNLPKNNFVALKLGVRRWFFSSTDNTDETLVLPGEAWVFEPRLNYTFWKIKSDRSLWQRNRLFGRVRGIALGVILGVDVRSEAHSWGAIDGAVFDPIDPRNNPDQVILLANQWLRAGWQMHDRVRTQFAQAAIWGNGGDDLTRSRVGGFNPYVIPIAGAPWAAYLSEKLVALEWSWHFRIGDEMETGLLFDGAFIEDQFRTGDISDFSPVGGLGLFADLPLGNWQVDVRGGWSPDLSGRAEAGQFAAFVSFGFSR